MQETILIGLIFNHKSVWALSTGFMIVGLMFDNSEKSSF